MRLCEFANDNNQSQDKLLALSIFLKDRAKDESAQAQISQDAFIQAAKSLGINVTPDTLGNLISQEPLSNVLEPLEPNSGVVRFKGNTEATTGMSVDQARAVVDSNAKAAMKRRQ
jgi:aryl-phospho-beta-D-glucosidase BglC (GH1 family)